MNKTRDNHYVPEWYQRGFLVNGKTDKLRYLDLNPEKIRLSNGKVKYLNELRWKPPSNCFYQTDLYTTFFGNYINDEVEKYLFGEIDTRGSRAVRAFIKKDVSGWHRHFTEFFSYIDAQKIRTPKSLQWIDEHYPDLGQVDLMVEMQAIRNMHCTIWTEGVREIVSAKFSETKFIISDHPVTIYNQAYSPRSSQCNYPNDPPIALKGSQTIFPLDINHCLILSNYEYVNDPENQDPTEKRTHARNFRSSLVRTDALIRVRDLNEEEVRKINYILKIRARRYLGAAKEEWLYPERHLKLEWSDLTKVLLPPHNELWRFGGEMYVGYKDGRTYYQDAFGRTQPENKHLKKPKRDKAIGRNDLCGCGSGRKFKKCCMYKAKSRRPSWDEMSIRERNIFFVTGIEKILGLSKNKTWEDVRRELSNEQVKEIHGLYGFLWPLDTDIMNLLPKPDKTLRALYTGIVDPRMIGRFATNLTPYFDEILIQNPFTNPWSVRAEFSPIDSPHQYKLQTLKNVSLLSMLIPYIDAGYINFFPDPCVFDSYLRNQMFSMAEKRAKGRPINSKDKEILEQLSRDDFNRQIWMLPKERQIKQIKEALPELSESQVRDTVEYIGQKMLDDPFALLQSDVFEAGGQLLMSSMSPNFEIAMFIAQATGSFLLTDSHHRWEEITLAQNKTNGSVVHNWKDLSNLINEKEYALSPDFRDAFFIRNAGRFGEFRKSMTNIYSEVRTHATPINNNLHSLKRKFAAAYRVLSKSTIDENNMVVKCKFDCVIPKGGFVHNNVQRMLLFSGTQNYLKNVSMAIFVDLCE